jgi:hypothetical protein
MKRLYFIIICLFFAKTVSFGQNIAASDMLKFSQTYPWGTARAMGLNGAFGALGADQSSMSINPAGIGLFRTSDLAFSLSMNNNTSDATWGTKSSDFTNKLTIGNLGYVYTNNTNKEEGWVSMSFGLAYNRLNDFNQKMIMKNPQGTSSLLDEFGYFANNKGAGPLPVADLYKYYEGLAYEYYALDNQLFSDGRYHSDFTTDYNRYGQYQERTREIKGGIGEYALSIAGNYSNKFYIGATLGIQSLRYEEIYNHTESTQNITDRSFPYLNSFTFSEHRTANGTGYNFKIGAIYKPFDILRLGLAFHTPTFYNINSEFYTSIDTYLKPNGTDPTYFGGSTDVRSENNTLQTPWKTIVSAALVLPKYGLLSIDYERLNYSKLRLSGDHIDTQNDDVSNYQAVNNLKIGAEVKLIGDFVVRGGLGLYGSPYKSSDMSSTKSTSYSAGIGYRAQRFYIDLAYVLVKYPEKYLLYTWSEKNNLPTNIPTYTDTNPQIVNIDHQLNRVVATIGFKF